MKYLMASILSVIFLFNTCSAQERPELNNQKDKESYSLGYQFGQNMKQEGVDLNLQVYTSGIQDALGEKEPQMKPEEISSTIVSFRQRLMAAHEKVVKEQGAKNLAETKAFLEDNGKKGDIKTLPSGLQYKSLKEGSGKIPKANDTVTVHYRGTLLNGTEIDNSYNRGKPETFKVTGVIPGWVEALQLMKEGSKWQLFIPPELAYGENGQGRVPPNSTLIFEVELISIGDGTGSKAATPNKPASKPKTK
jgi:FKBP-type peptidyl-prolyl cis-trans isomerase FklB